MRNMLIPVALLALMASPALAQRGDHDSAQRAREATGHPHASTTGQAGGMRGPAPQATPQPQAQPQAMQQHNPGMMQQNNSAMRTNNDRDRGGDNNNRGGNRSDNNRGDNNRGDNNRSDNNRRGDNNRYDNNRPNFNNGTRGPDNRFDRNDRRRATDYRDYHRNFNAPRRYRAPSYVRPRGWYSHRWTYGERLPSAFFVRNYWITDFFNFGLMDPPYGTTWVRYGSDALLVDEYSGEVIQVSYNVFY